MTRLKVINAAEARFECVFPSCGGVCCHDGRPVPEAAEVARISDNLERFLPHLRPVAQELLERRPFLTGRRKSNGRSLAVVDGSCVFFNEGCVLHKVGAAEGDRWRYKPWHCITFPLERDGRGGWFIRQTGRPDEQWNLDCLDPKASPRLAMEALTGEVGFVEQLEHGSERWRFAAVETDAESDLDEGEAA